MTNEIHYISRERLDFSILNEIVNEGKQLALSDQAKASILKCREYLDAKAGNNGKPIYGINTGFGSLCNHSISEEDLGQLQTNLVMSHACGTGDKVPEEIVKLMLLLKVQSLSYGNSGVQLETVERLISFYNEDVLPVVYEQGSLGASGDLAPLAHLSLPLLGMGEVYYEGRIQPTSVVLEEKNWKPIALKSKEGLALLNGTQFMSSYGVWSLMKSHQLSYLADLIASVSLEGFDGRKEPFDPLVHEIRPHNGQLKTAENMREFLEGSELIENEKEHVQDPYSFRCIPQVHGASKDAIAHVSQVFLTEINSVTDNPNVFVDEDKVISAGNFHGQALAMPLDYLAIAMAELANISERRTYKLISGERGLPAYLVAKPGLNSGFMIPQYTAASIVSANKQLCTPASVDSIVSSNGQEDHVSMGANAATKLFRVMCNVERVLAIEIMNAAQALEFRKGKSSPFIEMFVESFREEVPFMDVDRVLHDDIESAIDFIRTMEVDPEILY